MERLDSLEWTATALLFGLGCVFLHLSSMLLERRRRGNLKPWSSLPGPKPLPFLGNALEFASMPKGRPQVHRLWLDLARKHGPLYRVSLPFKKFVVVADPSLVQGVLGRKGLPKSAMYRVTLDVFSFRGRHDNMFTVQSTHDPRWLIARKGFAATVSEDAVRARFALVVGATERLCVALDKMRSGDSTLVEMQEASLRLALDVILAAAFEAEGGALEVVEKKDENKSGDDDERESGDDDERKSGDDGRTPSSSPSSAFSFAPCPLLDSLHECFEYIYGSLERPWLLPAFRILPFLPSARRHRRQHEELHRHWASLIAHVRSKRGGRSGGDPSDGAALPKSDGSYGSCIVRLVDHVTGRLQTDEQILSQASATVVAGMDTTAHALSFALLCVATTPGVQERVAEELRGLGLLGGGEGSSPPRPVDYSDVVQRIPYITAVIKESMRMYPVGGAGVGRVADRDVDIGGVLVKKGTEVAVPMFALHRAPWCWTDPDEFDPGRWLGGEEGGGGGGASAAEATAAATVTIAPRGKKGGDAEGASDARPFPRPLRRNEAAYLPFSSGPRDCLGRRFGEMELKTFLVMLCSRYEFEFDERANPEGGLEGLRGREVSKFTISFDGGLWLRARPRRAATGGGAEQL